MRAEYHVEATEWADRKTGAKRADVPAIFSPDGVRGEDERISKVRAELTGDELTGAGDRRVVGRAGQGDHVLFAGAELLREHDDQLGPPASPAGAGQGCDRRRRLMRQPIAPVQDRIREVVGQTLVAVVVAHVDDECFTGSDRSADRA
jgi:hypothetical protein